MSGLNYSLFRLSRIGRFALMPILALALFAATLSNAEAQSRRRAGVAIGVGILGAIILNEAARSERRYERYDRYYDDDHPAPRRSARRSRKKERYSEPPKSYSEPVQKKKKVRTASRRKSKSAPPVETAAVAAPAATEEAIEPTTEQAAADASPQPDNSYLPEVDQKAARRAAPKARDLPPVANAAPAPEAAPQDGVISTADEIKAAQQHLNYMGYDIPAGTGVLDARTRSAFGEFQRSLGAQPTGLLTYEQLQALFEKSASLAAKPR